MEKVKFADIKVKYNLKTNKTSIILDGEDITRYCRKITIKNEAHELPRVEIEMFTENLEVDEFLPIGSFAFNSPEND